MDGWMAAQGAWPIDGFQREKGGRLGRTDGKVKSQGKGEKVALYSAAAICQTPSAEEGITGRLIEESKRLPVAYHLFKVREERRLSP